MLQEILEKIDQLIGGLIDQSEMSADDKALLKTHLYAVQDILARNIESELSTAIKAITGAILSKF